MDVLDNTKVNTVLETCHAHCRNWDMWCRESFLQRHTQKESKMQLGPRKAESDLRSSETECCHLKC